VLQNYNARQRYAHGKDATKHTATSEARQRGTKTHGKEERHGKVRRERTTKIEAAAKAPTSAVHVDDAVNRVYLHGNDAFAVRLVVLHGKGPLPCGIPLSCAYYLFHLFSFLFYSFYYLCLFLN
jgi:hypothetical protein